MPTTAMTRRGNRARAALADCDIGWFEEPVVPEDLAGYAEVAAASRYPLPAASRVHALASANVGAARSTSSSRTSAPPAGSPNPRRSRTWPRPSACAACRTSGAPASAWPPRSSCSRCCRTNRRATARRADARVRPHRASLPPGHADEPIEHEAASCASRTAPASASSRSRRAGALQGGLTAPDARGA